MPCHSLPPDLETLPSARALTYTICIADDVSYVVRVHKTARTGRKRLIRQGIWSVHLTLKI